MYHSRRSEKHAVCVIFYVYLVRTLTDIQALSGHLVIFASQRELTAIESQSIPG